MLKTKNLFQQTFANEKVAGMIGSLDRFFIKLPHLPKKIRVLINKIVPFLTLAFGLIGLVASLITGFFLFLALISLDIEILWSIGGSFVLVLLSTLFLLKAFKPLRQGNAVGWIYLFWAQVLEVINFIINSFTVESDFWLGLATLIISFYLLFEIGQFYVYKVDKKLDQTKLPQNQG